MTTDTHAHVYWKSYDEDRPQVLERARAAGVERIVVVGTDLETSRAALALCAGDPRLYATAGLHPHEAERMDEAAFAELAALAAREDCVAVGETGLDWFKEYSPRDLQRASFRRQLALARELDKPVVVHCRDAHEDTVALLREHPGVRGVMHCYTFGPDELFPYLELGFYVSFSGVVTYPKNDANREAARRVPLERLLVETDSPFLAPQGRRGKRNEPAFAAEVLAAVARARGVPVAELAAATDANAVRLFGL
jgi:TatD DNase family protein